MAEIRRKVVGIGTAITETIKNEKSTKNTKTQKVERKYIKCIVLDCGHFIPVTAIPGKTPTNNCACRQCVDEGYNYLFYVDSFKLENGWIDD